MKLYIKSTESIVAKTLCVRDGDTIKHFRYARQDGRGEEYIGDNWWESYIVTPQDELLVWTMRGNYIPSAREFWIDENDDYKNLSASTIAAARYTTYQGHQIRVNDGETTPEAITRYRNQIAKEESDRLEAERIAKEEKLAAREQRRKTPRYSDGTIVLDKDGEYYQVYDGYYAEYYDDIAYDAVPCTETGKWITPRNDYEDLTVEIYQKDIQRKIK